MCCEELGKCVVRKIEESMCVSHTLPVSYRCDCRQRRAGFADDDVD